MEKAFIVLGSGEENRRVPVESSLTIGRAGHCGLVIRDSAASRQHLEIRASTNGYLCRDLKSRNGTWVNGVQTEGCALYDGDRIQIGETTLLFEVGARPATPAPSDKTVFLQTVLDPSGREKELQPSSVSKDFLEAAYTLMNALASNFDSCELVDRILQITTEGIRAQRGAVLFAGQGGELLPCQVCGNVHMIRNGVLQPADVSQIEISTTVARRVLDRGENVLYQSAQSDSLVDASASISDFNLTSILCVPIRTKDRIQGILYVDTDVSDHSYTQDDLLLAAAAGNSAGLALQNASNHQALLEKQRLEQDIEAAWTIQEGFLVNEWPADDPRFEVFGMTQPAKIVGGDFYDFARIDQDRVGILIGDVSGKGMPAALAMAQLLAEFRMAARGVGSPTELFDRLNGNLVARSQRGMFCTVCLVALNLRSGRFLGANAGHHPALLVSREGIATALEASGPPLGILSGASWRDAEGYLDTGEAFFLYTDGIVEARAGTTVVPAGRPPVEYGIDNLQAAVQANQAGGPRQLVEEVLRDVRQFCSPLPPHDDCTAISLRFHGNPGEPQPDGGHR
ncbi:MAG: SpoIIE family protein phosphatase [Acidobacteriota bacterium]